MPSDKLKQPVIWRKTTTSTNPNRNGNGNNEENASSAELGTNRNSATTTATIRTRSPRKMKTQIAKLVYDPPTIPKRDVVVNENETPVVEEEFQKKREDRDREVKEIQEMLNEITNTPTKEKNDEKGLKQQEVVITNSSSTKQAPAIQRSKTETNLRPPTARRSQLRLESKTARSKSAQTVEKEDTSPNQRQKTYNSEEARRYMQEQKKKRKSLQTAAQASDRKPIIDKNEIKKRLDNLRKNTRQIVDKNVKMAKKKAVAMPRNREEQKNKPNQVVNELEIEIETTRADIWSDRAPKKKVPEEKRQDPSPLSENYKKVGLLRKPEIKDHSFSAIKDLNMDKENLVLDMLTPKMEDVAISRLTTEVKAIESKKPELVLSTKRENIIDLEPKRQQELSQKSNVNVPSTKRSSIPELDLRVPDAKLRSLREKSVQVERSVLGSSKSQNKDAELPYWLKPTAVQSYPYNFIMAVRKKLEAIANPPAVASSSSTLLHQSKRTDKESARNSKSNSVKRRLIDNVDKSLTRSVEKSTSAEKNFMDHQLSKSLSEVSSNFSSISIQLPDSNTIRSLKSRSQKRNIDEKKPLRADEDDTTVSSSVFSSPEKKKSVNGSSNNLPLGSEHVKALSPLSTENISNLHIKSRSMLKNVNVDRGDNFPDTASQHKLDTGAISSRSEGSIDFSQLLDDFNRSLSQVIEVNHQLKTTLVKSHQIFSPEKNQCPTVTELKSGIFSTKSVELAEYVSDFEESSNGEDKRSKDLNETLTSSSIPEVHTASNKSTETNTGKSSSSSSAEEAVEDETPISSSAEEIQSQESQERSLVSLRTQTFTISSEEAANDSLRTRTIHEVIEESPSKENMSANQYSRDSLETSPREEYIKSHINTSRGDFQGEESDHSAGPPPSYKATSKSQDTADPSKSNFMNSSLDSEFVRVFNTSDIEISVLSLNRSLSESTINYSSIGLYEQLIQNETNKSEHLAALLKMREKALIDRTKGQIAWLEVQKERYKAKGLTLQISAVKKKQRGILLKMEKEREEIKKLLQQTKVQRDQKLRIPEIRLSSDVTLLQQRRTGIQTSAASQPASILQQKPQQQQQQQQKHHRNQHQSARSKSSAIVRGYELESSRSLEQLLQKREEDLRRRREHVERLMEWHRRLDQEEAEVFQLERMLLDYNNVQHMQQENAQEDNSASQTKMEKKLKEIDRSLRELSSISGAEGSGDAGVIDDSVRTTGSKLNKLWRRLTSQRTEKFEPNKRYKLCKSDLEQLYEEAKLAVLHDFGESAGQMEVFLGQSSNSNSKQSSLGGEVPHLNLNFSSGQSDADIVQGNYSPSTAEEDFLGFDLASTSSKDEFSLESDKQHASVSKKKVKSGKTSSSALPSLPETDQSSSSDNMLIKSLANMAAETGASCMVSALNSDFITNSVHREDDKNAGATKTTVPYNERTIRPENEKHSDCSANTESKLKMVPETALSNDLSASGSTKTKGNLPIPVQSAANASDSTRTISNRTIESTSVFDKSADIIRPQSSRSPVPEGYPHMKTVTKRAVLPESALNSASAAKPESERTSLIESNSNPAESTNTENNCGCISENVLNSNFSTKTESFTENTSNGVSEISGISLRQSVLTSGSVTDSNTRSNVQTESEQANLLDRSTNSFPNSNQILTSGPKNLVSLLNSATSIDSYYEGHRILNSVSNAKTESLAKSASITESSTEIESAAEATANSDGGTKSSLPESLHITEPDDDSKDCFDTKSSVATTSSIVESLLNCSHTSSTLPIVELDQASENTEQRQHNSDWLSVAIQSKSLTEKADFREDNMSIARTHDISRRESVTNETEFNEDPCTTLRSIKSIDNSTNSKHSTDQTTNLNTASISSKPESLPIETDVIIQKDTLHSEHTMHDSVSDHHEKPFQSSRDTTTSEGVPQSYTYAYDFSASEIADTMNSNQLRSSVIMSTRESPMQMEDSETLANAFYESDFTEGEETNIDDLSMPKYETTVKDPSNESQLNTSQSSSPTKRTDLEKRLIDLDVSLKDLNDTFEKAVSPEKALNPPHDDVGNNRGHQEHLSKEQNESSLMPDIISEVELRRRQQIMLENEMKQFEHAVPYMYVREIPNKPPPPYVPPAHGSPMTTIFPSEERIKDITYRRTKELYHEILNIDTIDESGNKPPSVLDENITNIYERIILDICKEYLTEYEPVLNSADPNNFHSPLAFFNPPDRLKCMQDFIYKEVRKSLAMDKNSAKRSQVFSVYGHRGKRDHIGEIIIQDMYEEDDRWSNFYVEEAEVVELIIDEMIGGAIRTIAGEVLEEEVPIDPPATAAASADVH